MTLLRDQGFLQQNKMTLGLKVCLKKTEAKVKKHAAKKKRLEKKDRKKLRLNDIRKLTFNNVRPQVETFKDILSDSSVHPNSDPNDASFFPLVINQTFATKVYINST